MVIERGDVLWIRFPARQDSEPAGLRPAVVLQSNRFNRTRINTVIVTAITSNLRYAALPGNVRLLKGEAGLPKPSVINMTQIAAIDLCYVEGKIGHLSPRRMEEIWNGLCLVMGPD
ncbi:MAG: type II toxin-antitoxin system PemK/MazF family toxin [Vulcanimicrobiota bacterium]